MSKNQLTSLLLATLFLFYACSKKGGSPNPPPTPVPGCASGIGPASGSFVTSTSVTLSWNSVGTASAYDIYLGTTPVPTTVVASNVTGTTYNYTIPATPNVTYYWYALPKNSGGSATGCTGTIQSFTYIVITPPASLGYYGWDTCLLTVILPLYRM